MSSCKVIQNKKLKEEYQHARRADIIELAHIFEKTNHQLHIREDHGPNMLCDLDRGYNAGYTLLGRMFALGQVEGILSTVDRELGINQ